MRFIICINNYGVFKKDVQYATSYYNDDMKPLYQIYSKPGYRFIGEVKYLDFQKNFMYCGDYNIELSWCDELFNLLMDGKGDMYKIVY